MGTSIDASGIFVYVLFIAIVSAMIWVIHYVIKGKKDIHDIKINPLAPIFGLWFIIGLWLGDLMSLSMANNGFTAMAGLNPIESSKVPALFVWCISLLAMFSINYFFLKINERKVNKKLYSFNKMLVYTQLFGLIVFSISALAMVIFGYDSTFLGFYVLNLYHATLPLILFTLFILAIDIK
jgi:hypothetical protein